MSKIFPFLCCLVSVPLGLAFDSAFQTTIAMITSKPRAITAAPVITPATWRWLQSMWLNNHRFSYPTCHALVVVEPVEEAAVRVPPDFVVFTLTPLEECDAVVEVVEIAIVGVVGVIVVVVVVLVVWNNNVKC